MAGFTVIVAQVAAAILASPVTPAVPAAAPPSAAIAAPSSAAIVMAADDVAIRDTTQVPPREWLLGHSGKLRAHFVSLLHPSEGALLVERFFGAMATVIPGVYTVPDSAFGEPITFITMLPFLIKQGGRVGPYRVGWWPEERHRLRSPVYANPDGFIEVTPENADVPVSEHFRLRDFLTHDQTDVWPKYLVLREALVDKLELINDDLVANGHPRARLVILSGFRSPQYNAQGLGRRGGRARDSRHQFGDAADVYVDEGTGRMADLNGDGRVDLRDARMLLASVDRVEAAHPELTGGAGVYHATGVHGPFLHVDVRGNAARWGQYRGPLLGAPLRRKIHHGTPNAKRASGTTAAGHTTRTGS